MAPTTLIFARVACCVAGLTLLAAGSVAAATPEDPSVSQYVEQIPTAEGPKPTTPSQPEPEAPTEAPSPTAEPVPAPEEPSTEEPPAQPPEAEEPSVVQETTPEEPEPTAEASSTESAEDGLGRVEWTSIVLAVLLATALGAYVLRRRLSR